PRGPIVACLRCRPVLLRGMHPPLVATSSKHTGPAQAGFTRFPHSFSDTAGAQVRGLRKILVAPSETAGTLHKGRSRSGKRVVALSRSGRRAGRRTNRG